MFINTAEQKHFYSNNFTFTYKKFNYEISNYTNYIKDQLTRIFSESSAKIPKFLLPTINEQLPSGVALKRAALILAAWCHYLELAPFAASDYNVQDEMKQLLIEKATEAANGDPLAFLKIRSIFGDLAAEEKFSHQYLFFMTQIRKDGVAKVIKAIAEY